MVAVSRPVKRKTIFQGAIDEPCIAVPWAIPYATRPPKICAQPLKPNQIPMRVPCSFLVYHCQSLDEVLHVEGALILLER